MTEAEAAPTSPAHSKLQWRILIGFVAGLACGLAVYAGARDAAWVDTVVTYVTTPIGQIFLRLLFMLVLPLLFSALVIGISEMGEVRSLRSVGLWTLGYTLVVSGIAVAISLLVVNLLQPGAGVDPVMAQAMIGDARENAAGII
jgi:Na+/H+-dicarboxylate symporter